jgi:hypothetical protein
MNPVRHTITHSTSIIFTEKSSPTWNNNKADESACYFLLNNVQLPGDIWFFASAESTCHHSERLFYLYDSRCYSCHMPFFTKQQFYRISFDRYSARV